ncbi:MAG TPA: MarR family transcriptional regulator [Rhodocyclaceae bacterium]|jgi:MarR family transcriptional repressor of emrRAB|nr:MarR family transcriptional regulator [Rhodocyclaceae bacterium]
MSAFDSTARRIARCKERMPEYPVQMVTLSRLAYHVQKRVQDKLSAALKEYEMTTVGYTALMVLYGSETETQRASELGEACSEKPANMTRICNELAARGLIDRRSSDNDRRGVVITLTEAGRNMVEMLSPEYWAIVAQTYAGIDDASLQKHEQMLHHQLDNLED